MGNFNPVKYIFLHLCEIKKISLISMDRLYFVFPIHNFAFLSLWLIKDYCSFFTAH